MRQRDARYEHIKPMLGGKVQSFTDIFKVIPKSVVAKDLGKKVDRFNELMEKVEEFTIGEMLIIGGFCELNFTEIFTLVERELINRRNSLHSDELS